MKSEEKSNLGEGGLTHLNPSPQSESIPPPPNRNFVVTALIFGELRLLPFSVKCNDLEMPDIDVTGGQHRYGSVPPMSVSATAYIKPAMD